MGVEAPGEAEDAGEKDDGAEGDLGGMTVRMIALDRVWWLGGEKHTKRAWRRDNRSV